MRRFGRLRRRGATREPLARVLIVCEGQVTEPHYFNQLRHLERCPVALKLHGGAVPKTLVEMAVKMKKESGARAGRKRDQNLRYDHVWCVFDVDAHPSIADALQQARDNGICTAVSNPCFELWALLHFQDQTKSVTRQVVQSLCRKHMPGYAKELPCEELIAKCEDAVARSTALVKWHSDRGTPGGNPSTTVHELVRLIRMQRAAWR